jgi:rod shape-determining protein MreC
MVMMAVLIVLITACILFLALSSRQPQIARGPGRLAISFVAPFQKVIIQSTRFLRDIWDHYFFLVTVAEEDKALRQRLRQAEALNYQCRETLLANDRLRKLLDLKKAVEEATLTAQVISKDPSPWFQTMLVDKGSDDGVVKGAPVINPEGIVGLVVEASGHYAKVRLITDPNSAVDALVQKSRARGVLKGGTSGSCVLNYVLRKHNLEIGDTVITSGMDGVFPKGLPIGQVDDIIKLEAGIFQDVTVTPFVDFERLEEVLIITQSEPVDPT